MAGLLSALLLARDGHRVTVYERDDTDVPDTADQAFDDFGVGFSVRLQLGHAGSADANQGAFGRHEEGVGQDEHDQGRQSQQVGPEERHGQGAFAPSER